MKDFESTIPASETYVPGSEKENESDRKTSRRSFLGRAGKAAIAVSTGAYAIGQHGSTKFEREKAEQHEGEKNWEMWRNRLLSRLKEIHDRLIGLDTTEVIKSEVGGFRADPTKVIESYKKAHDKIFVHISQLIDQLANDIRFRKLLPALAKSVESSLQTFKRPHDLWFYGTELEFIEKQLNSVLYAQKMEQEYGLRIQAASKDFFIADVEDMYNDLQKIPPFTVRRAGVKEIYLDETNWAAGSAVPGFPMEMQPNAKDTINHELSHYLDFLNENLWRFWKDDPETKAWRQLNKGAKPYGYHYGFEVIVRDKLRTKNPDQKINREQGYAEDYGQEGGLYEDRATVSENLFKLGPLLFLVERAVNDPILKKKVELMTGYHLDKPASVHIGRGFGTPVSEEEYKQAGFSGRDYWSEWSRDDKGRIWMDADYYNDILNYKIVTFSEENGQTVRHVKNLSR